MAELPVTTISITAGLDPDDGVTLVAVSASDTFVNDGNTFLVVKNTHASVDCDISISAPGGTDQDVPGYGTVVIPDMPITGDPTITCVALTGEVWLQVPFRSYNSGSSTTVTFSSTTNVVAGAVRLAS